MHTICHYLQKNSRATFLQRLLKFLRLYYPGHPQHQILSFCRPRLPYSVFVRQDRSHSYPVPPGLISWLGCITHCTRHILYHFRTREALIFPAAFETFVDIFCTVTLFVIVDAKNRTDKAIPIADSSFFNIISRLKCFLRITCCKEHCQTEIYGICEGVKHDLVV